MPFNQIVVPLQIIPVILSFSIQNYEMALRDFGSMGKKREVPWNPLEPFHSLLWKKPRIIWIISKGTNIWFYGICFLSFFLLLFQIRYQSALQLPETQFLSVFQSKHYCQYWLNPQMSLILEVEVSSKELPKGFCLPHQPGWDSHFPHHFLDASLNLYKRPCPSVGWLVGPSVRPSVRR